MRSPDFRRQEHSREWYDLFEDWELIEASFAAQYGIRLRRESGMSWGEFCTLLSGILPETPLGQVVSIRSETDQKRIEAFTPAQRRIYDQWAGRGMRMETDPAEYERFMRMIERAFLQIGGEKHGG